jgi:hypothetical protein
MDYDHYRPHRSLGHMMAVAFVAGCIWADPFDTNEKWK